MSGQREFGVMQTIPVEIDDDVDFNALLEAGSAFDFLRDEPELYSDADIRPGRANPAFGRCCPENPPARTPANLS